MKNDQITATVSGKATVTGSTAKARIHLNFKQQGHTIDARRILSMQQQSGKWCVAAGGFQPDQSSMKVDGQSLNSIAGGGSSGLSGGDSGSMPTMPTMDTGGAGMPSGLPGGG